MRKGFGIVIGSLAALVLGELSFAATVNDLRIQTFQYASEDRPTFSLSNKFVFESEHFLSGTQIYYESGSRGIFSFDPDPLRYSFFLNESERSFVWIGREHPLNPTRGFAVEPYTALGSVWAQNQTEALDPRVAGWLSIGFIQTLSSHFKITAAYSPLFLPTFGPGLGFTDRGDLNPNRFARLPPSNAITGGVNLPIRYQLKLGELSKLLLQHQAFVGLSHQTDGLKLELYAFTAPRPDPVPTTDARLSVNSNDVNAQVTIDPKFPREHWAGFRAQLPELLFQPAFELVQSLNDYALHVGSLTGYFDTPDFSQLKVKRAAKSAFGILSHFQRVFVGPSQSDLLLFLKVPVQLSEEFTYRTFIQATLWTARESIYWLNELEYQIQKGFSATAALRILAGKDHSYFGDWRNLDSYSVGLRWIW